MLKLYSAPESIAMATHIALAESGLSYEVELIDHLARRHFDGRPFTDVNAKGYIPALVLEDGSILTETIATLIYVADHAPDSRLGGADERYRVLEWLSFLTTEIHQRLMRFQQPGCSSEMAAATRGQLIERVGFAAAALKADAFLLGDTPTVADILLYVATRWLKFIDVDVGNWPTLKSFMDRMEVRPQLRIALAEEGLE